MPFTAELKRPSDPPSVSTLPAPASGIAERWGSYDEDERPTEPAPAVHSFLVPKFPRDPRLPDLAELTLHANECLEPAEAVYVPRYSTFRPAPILRHVYCPVREPMSRVQEL